MFRFYDTPFSPYRILLTPPSNTHGWRLKKVLAVVSPLFITNLIFFNVFVFCILINSCNFNIA